MKQLVLDLKSGQTQLMEVPAPLVRQGCILVQTSYSLVSAGTERMLVDFGKAGWVSKARQQPDRVRQVLQKIRTDGLKPTVNAVFNKLGQPLPLGYSQSGTVIGVGRNAGNFKVGDRVATNGYHAELVCVPHHLAAKVPASVSDEAAAFTVIGAIGLQSIRLLAPSLGETIVVIGLGLIGKLTVQLLRANGCKVIGFDVAEAQLAMADYPTANTTEQDPVAFALAASAGIGVDGVIITASADDDRIISQAAQMCRKRGRIVLTGVVGLHLKRSDFYEKELSFQVSCSYGPGRYEPAYEQQGLDYPIGFVRWTEQRNFEAVLHAMEAGQLKVDEFIAKTVPFDQYASVYDALNKQQGAVLLQYDTTKAHHSVVGPVTNSSVKTHGATGIIGAGSFATGVLLPQLQKAGGQLMCIASKSGLSATAAAQKFGIPAVTTDASLLLQDPSLDLICIATPHEQHAAMAAAALRSGKHVFVEKPMAIDREGLQQIALAYQQSGRQLFVGFNRRFAPLAQQMKALLARPGGPINIVMTVNAGTIDARHWLNWAESGGRLIGEACHFADLASFLAGSPIMSVMATAAGTDGAAILLRFANDTTATINYLTNGSKAYDKERIEVFSDGRILILENWKQLRGYGFPRFSGKSMSQDKGHEAQFRAVMQTVLQGAPAPIPFSSLMNTSEAAIAIPESIQMRTWIDIPFA